MAMKIIASRSETIKDGKNYMRAEIMADSAADLSVEGISNYHFTFGSIAYAIAEKTFYILNSSEEWVSSSEDDTSASTLSTNALNRPSGLFSMKNDIIQPNVSESNTNDSDDISDDVKEEPEETEEELAMNDISEEQEEEPTEEEGE